MSQPRGCVQSSQQVYRGGSPGLRVVRFRGRGEGGEYGRPRRCCCAASLSCMLLWPYLADKVLFTSPGEDWARTGADLTVGDGRSQARCAFAWLTT